MFSSPFIRWWHWKKCPCTFRNNFATKSLLCEQIQKLKERNKLFGTMTVEHNQLLAQLGEIETHLRISQTEKLVGCLSLHAQYKKVVTNISQSQIRCFSAREVGWRQLEKWNGVEFVSTNIHTYRCLQSPWPKSQIAYIWAENAAKISALHLLCAIFGGLCMKSVDQDDTKVFQDICGWKFECCMVKVRDDRAGKATVSI